ncbi:transposable element Tc1 transposase [Trichonephila clavipes]|nr:transposable element Tc1 transposase [Trichonephila clavipes]
MWSQEYFRTKKTEDKFNLICYLITAGIVTASEKLQPELIDLKRNRMKFEQISEFERGRIVGLREAGLSYRAVAARVQRNSSTIMRVSKQWTDEGRTARKSGSGPRNVTSAREDRRLVRMAQTDRTAFSRQLVAQWSTATRFIVCFINSVTSAAAWAAHKDSFIQDFSHAKPSPPATTLGQCA